MGGVNVINLGCHFRKSTDSEAVYVQRHIRDRLSVSCNKEGTTAEILDFVSVLKKQRRRVLERRLGSGKGIVFMRGG